jgi:hypothetical protein
MNRNIIRTSIILIYCSLSSKPARGIMTLSGPVIASAVTVSGDVTVSSITVSTITISNLLSITGAKFDIPGRVVQIKFSSSTVLDYSVVTSTTFTAVSSIVQSITPSNANNYIRICLSGNLSTDGSGTPIYITIYRDSTNLGEPSLGLSAAISSIVITDGLEKSVGIVIDDWPGDTNPHTYQAFIRSTVSGNAAIFSFDVPGYLLLEEISQ